MQSFIILSLASALSFLILCQLLSRRRDSLPLPPGPKGLPFVGNLRDIVNIGENPWVTYNEWSQVFGDVLHLNVLGHRTVVLNSYKVTNDLLDKRSHNYSDRPDMPMFVDLMGAEWNLGIMRYSDWWRLHRRTFNQFFQSRAVSQYFDIQRAATVELMNRLESSPEDFFQHVRNQAGSILLKLVYGYTLQTKDDPYLQLFHNASEGIIATTIHGTFWVDYFPILKYLPGYVMPRILRDIAHTAHISIEWLPGAGFKRKARVWRQQLFDLKDKPWEWIKQATVRVPSCTFDHFLVVPP
ncbi:hypothetical protein PQX77_001437 [Marasmius sp. AFHP31]|nr:hypothetical protein PQX77_001437 [Marasmius sp. AFHP31]